MAGSCLCRYVQGNRIHDLAALNQLPQLKTLNVSNNDVSSIDGIEACRELSTLVCSDNKLVDHKSIAALRLLEKLSTLDIQDNQLEDVEVGILALQGCHAPYFSEMGRIQRHDAKEYTCMRPSNKLSNVKHSALCVHGR